MKRHDPIKRAFAGVRRERRRFSMICRMYSRVPTPAKLIGSEEIVRSTGMMAKSRSAGEDAERVGDAKRKVTNVARCPTSERRMRPAWPSNDAHRW